MPDTVNPAERLNGSWGPIVLAEQGQLGDLTKEDVLPFSTTPDAAKIAKLMSERVQK